MIIKFKKLTLKNFLSTGNAVQEIDLDTSMLTLILGLIAETESGMKNGAGKTTILQAVSYGLFGKPLTSIKIPNLVNNTNKKAMSVSIDFLVGEKEYRIERGQKPNFLRFFVNKTEVKGKASEAENEALGENKSTQVEINRVIGMSHLLFKHIVGLNTFTTPFLRERDSTQREIIEELLGMTQLSQRAETLGALIKKTKDDVREKQARYTATVEANARIEKTMASLESTARNWTATHEARLEKLAADIEDLIHIDYDAAVAAFDAQEAYDREKQRLTTEMAPLKATHSTKAAELRMLDERIGREEQGAATLAVGTSDRMSREIDRKRSDIKRYEQAIAKLRSRHTQLTEDRFGGDDEVCSCCGQSLTGTDHLAKVHAALDAQIEECLKSIEREEGEVQARLREIAVIEQEIETAKSEAERKKTDAINRVADLRFERANVAVDLERLKEEVTQQDAQLAALGARPLVPFASRDDLYQTRNARAILERDLENEFAKANPYTDQIAALQTTLQLVDRTDLDVLLDEQKHQEFLQKLLTSHDSFVRKKIVDQNLRYLNARISHYLHALTLPHSVVFESDLSVTIQHLGNDYDFEQLSRGEMNRVIMATAFAFRDVWENLNHAINLLWVDELLDNGTCTPGVEAALTILQNMGLKRGKNIFLVSHKEELKSRINDTLLCLKDKEFTTFERDAERAI